MHLNTPLHAEHQLDQLAGQFEHWRQTRARRDRIPQALWEQAVALARVLPHSRVAQHLRLSANALKKQMAMTPQVLPAPSLPLGFVEVPSACASPQPPHALQLEVHRGDGTRLCLHAAAATLSLDTLVRAFLEAH